MPPRSERANRSLYLESIPGTALPPELAIAYISGGSRGWAWTRMGDLALEPVLQGVVRLYGLPPLQAPAIALISAWARHDFSPVAHQRNQPKPE